MGEALTPCELSDMDFCRNVVLVERDLKRNQLREFFAKAENIQREGQVDIEVLKTIGKTVFADSWWEE